MDFHTRYNPPIHEGVFFDPDAGPGDPDVSKTHREFAKEADINTIVTRFLKTGVVAPMFDRSKYPVLFEDCTGVPTYQDMLNMTNDARNSFMALPSAIRAHFGNDPGNLLAALQNPEERAFLQKHGILNPDPPTSTPAEPEINPEPSRA